MKEWVFVLNKKDFTELGKVRLVPGLLAAADDGSIWLRGLPAPENPDLRVRQLPVVQTYITDQEGKLFPPEKLTPTGKLKSLDWRPISSFITVEPPVSLLPGQVNRSFRIRIAPSEATAAPAALITGWDTWKAFAETAPLARLERLKYAVSEKGRVLVLGDPLPSIPGRSFWRRQNILLPAGFDLEIPATAGLAERRLNPLGDALIIFKPDGQWEKISVAGIFPVTRSGVRLVKNT